MPVTFNVASHGSNPLQMKPVKTAAALLEQSAHREFTKVERTIQSSFTDDYLASHPIEATSNGFTNAVLRAYNQHHHLVLRPDDIWQAIILQFNFYVNAHAEELRHLFVAHEDQKKLTVEVPSTRTYDWSRFPIQIGAMIEDNIIDPGLRAWLVPDFTTTTPHDKVVASITMMATLQAYFTYKCIVFCGIPRVTLLGTRGDWVSLCDRAEKLPSFGEEPAQWHSLLKPILSRFVTAFDSPDSEANVDFWQRICHRQYRGSGSPMITGWLTGFCFWNNDGQRLDIWGLRKDALEIDGAKFHRVSEPDLPAGWVGVPVLVEGDEPKYEGRMVVGHVGIGHLEGDEDSVRPVSGWWMFELKDESLNSKA